jgi:Ca2+-transporting ATPase
MTPFNFIEGVDFAKNPCEYFSKGKVKACTLSLTVLVMLEMFNSLNAISEDNSLLRINPLVNPYLLLAITGSVSLHLVILYIPFASKIFGVAPLNMKEWMIVIAFSAPVILVDELLKILGRRFNEAELRQRLKKVKSD